VVRSWSIDSIVLLLVQGVIAGYGVALLSQVFPSLSFPALGAPACSVVRIADHQPAAYPHQHDGRNDAHADNESDACGCDSVGRAIFYEARHEMYNGRHSLCADGVTVCCYVFTNDGVLRCRGICGTIVETWCKRQETKEDFI